jgi:hypothetical protein
LDGQVYAPVFARAFEADEDTVAAKNNQSTMQCEASYGYDILHASPLRIRASTIHAFVVRRSLAELREVGSAKIQDCVSRFGKGVLMIAHTSNKTLLSYSAIVIYCKWLIDLFDWLDAEEEEGHRRDRLSLSFLPID